MNDKFEKIAREKEDLDESVMYISSNWSARVSLRTEHKPNKVVLPTLDI